MKIIVFSDSHGRKDVMWNIAEEERPDMIFHLGDYEPDSDLFLGVIPVVKVRGNCDYNSYEEAERFLDYGPTKILLTHGHLYAVKQGLMYLIQEGTAKGATVILYGHTHRAYLDKAAGRVVMNPGTPDKSYGVLELKNGVLVDVRLEETRAELR